MYVANMCYVIVLRISVVYAHMVTYGARNFKPFPFVFKVKSNFCTFFTHRAASRMLIMYRRYIYVLRMYVTYKCCVRMFRTAFAYVFNLFNAATQLRKVYT